MAERKNKTERERAEEALGIAQRKVDKLTADVARHEKDLKTAKRELTDAERLLAYRAAHPELPSSDDEPQTDQPDPPAAEEENHQS